MQEVTKNLMFTGITADGKEFSIYDTGEVIGDLEFKVVCNYFVAIMDQEIAKRVTVLERELRSKYNCPPSDKTMTLTH